MLPDVRRIPATHSPRKMCLIRVFLILVFPLNVISQCTFSERHVLQKEGIEEEERICLIEQFNSHGNLLFQKLIGYKYGDQEHGIHESKYYVYKDSLLKEIITVASPKRYRGIDTMRVVKSYEEGRLDNEKTYVYKSKLSETFKGEYPTFPDDYSSGEWALYEDKDFYYDKNNNLIEEYALAKSSISHNRSTYEYDDEGRLSIKMAYDDSRLLWTRYYEYEPNKEIIVCEWEITGAKESSEYSFIQAETRYLNDAGRIVRKEYRNEGDGRTTIKNVTYTYEYDTANRIKRMTVNNSGEDPHLIHDYVYLE